MLKRLNLKKLLLLTAVFTLVMALALPMTLAQEGEGDDHGEETTEEVAADDHGEEAAEEGEGGGISALGINMGFLVAQIVNFFIIAFALTRMIWGPVVNMLDSRSAEIAKGLEDAAEAARARQNAEADAEKIRSEARADVQKMLDEARGRGDELAKTIESSARQEADQVLSDARADAESARDRELAGMRDQVLNISKAMTQALIGQSLDESQQRALVDRFFTNLPADAKSLSGNVEVVSAMPLSDDEKSRIEGELSADSVTYSVDPSILGGLILRAGDRVIDGSVRSNMNALSEQLN